jgi:hypothetical protein
MKLQNIILDHIIRRKVQFDKIPKDRYSIRIARTIEQYESAFRLVHITYAALGIEPMRPVDLRVTEQHVLREAIVLVAYEGEQPVGTITITADSPAGLPLDADYPDALKKLRARGAHLAEIGSFAIVGRCQKGGLAQLLAMAALRIAFRTLSACHAVIGIHPRASALYRATWGFTSLDRPREHASLRAPVAGHVVARDHLLDHVGRHFRKPMTSGMLPEAHLFAGPLLPCVSVPDDSLNADLRAFRMPRDVFRALFLERTDRISKLSPSTLSHLREQRTDETLAHNPQQLRKVC